MAVMTVRVFTEIWGRSRLILRQVQLIDLARALICNVVGAMRRILHSGTVSNTLQQQSRERCAE